VLGGRGRESSGPLQVRLGSPDLPKREFAGRTMSNDLGQHPSDQQLADFLHGRLAPAEQTALEEHIAQCSQCCRALEAVPDDTLLEPLRSRNTPVGPRPSAAAAPPEAPPELLAHPRYRIVRQL